LSVSLEESVGGGEGRLAVSLANTSVWRGRRMDATGLIWQGSRYYEPRVGRFMSPDVYGHEGSIDLYSYANGDPINGCDPDGRYFTYAYKGIKQRPDILVKTFGSIGISMVPGISTANDFEEFRTGRDIWGEELSWLERGISGVSAGLEMMPWAGGLAAGTLKSPVKIARGINKAARIGEASRKLERVGKHVVKFEDMEVRAVRDLSHLDVETLYKMKKMGRAPNSISGKKISLHHLNQDANGPLVEMPKNYNNIWNSRQHPYVNEANRGLTTQQRADFNNYRIEYWKARAEEELKKREIWYE
jgi:RHS repeat-associated protein